MKKTLFILFLCVSFIKINAQTDSLFFKKNLIKLSASVLPELILDYSLDYERNILNKKILKINFGATVGQCFIICNKDVVFHTVCDLLSFTSSFNSLIGKKSHFFEINAGVRYSILDGKYNTPLEQWFPVLNIGYRYQNYKGKGLVFRTFVGLMGIGISVGKSF